MEIIIVISALLLVLFIAYSFVITKQNHIKLSMVAMSEESLIKTSIKLVKTLRITSNGKGVTTNGLYGKIKRCNKMLMRKNAKNNILSEAEKWFFENYYLAFRGIFSQKTDLSDLPHCDGVPRIITIARHIVKNSLGTLSIERTRKVFENIKEHISLNFAETNSINFALNFAILEQIYILSERLLFQEDCKLRAKRGQIDRQLLKYDSYCYYLYSIADLSPTQKDYLQKLGITYERVCLGHNQTTMDNAKMAKDLFGSLQIIDEFVPAKIGLEYIAPNAVLKTAQNYKVLSDETLFSYCRVIEEISKKLNINEGYIAQKAMELAEVNKLDVAFVFYDYKKQLIRYIKDSGKNIISKEEKYSKQYLYIFVNAFFAVILSFSLYFVVGYYCILFLLPLYFFSIKLINFVLDFSKKEKAVLSCCYPQVPDNAAVLAVICEYVDNLGQLSKSLRHAEIIKANAKDENIKVALLLDLKKSNAPTSDFDKEVGEYLSKYNFNEDINIFIRKRVKNGKFYQGHERKRGAIMSLNKMLINKNYNEFWYVHNKDEVITPKYVVCLDADSMILPCGIKQMVNIFEHPYNNGKYDMLSTINRYNLFSVKNKFAKEFYKEGGVDLYPNYSPFYYKYFGMGLFCGKGIYKLNAFYNKLEGIFPDNKILSHDLLEGSVLNCGVANIIFEDAPNSFLSENDRQSRWKKGDIQLIPFISGKWKNEKKEKIHVKIPPLNKFIMTNNVLSLFLPILLAVVFILGVIFESPALLASAAGVFLLPYILDIISIMRQISNNVRIMYICIDLCRCVKRLFVNFFSLLFDAINNVIIFSKTVVNMLLNKNMLVWRPFFQTQNGSNGLIRYAALFCPALIIGAVLTAIGVYFSYAGMIFGIYVILSLVVPVYLYIISMPKAQKEIKPIDKKFLHSIAAKTYKYFEYMYMYEGIVADNLQIRPYKGDAKKTSPTNIGFGMLAEIAAEKLGIISQTDCTDHIIKTLKNIKNLPKWHGNLYNWYDIDKKEPISPFVSSVDSGNFLAALIVVKSYFHRTKNFVGELTAQILINNTNLNRLYDESKQMFYIGYDGEKYVSHYDLLNSEARLLSEIYVSLYGKTEHYFSLKRDYCSLYGNTMMSWSGTAFEYLMPQLFIDAPVFSAVENTNRNVVKYQIKNTFNDLWGISECGYAKLDNRQNYQYYAFGLKGLSLKNEENKGLVAPYASALCLNYNLEKVIENFRKFEKMDMLDEYGFLESIDTENNSIIYSYMSHHQGMLLCALCNTLCDNYIKELFNNSPSMEGASQVCNEISSVNRFMPQIDKKVQKIAVSDIMYYKNIDKIEYTNETMAISDGKITLFSSILGNTFVKYDNILLNKFVPIFEENYGGYFYIKEKDEVYSPTYMPQKQNRDNFSYMYTNSNVTYANKEKSLTLNMAILPTISGVVYRLAANKANDGKIYFYMPITLCGYSDYCSHPAFYDLFVNAFVEDGILYITRKGREISEKQTVMAVKLSGVRNVTWIANRAVFLGRNGKPEEPDYIFKTNQDLRENLPMLGDILSPCVAFEAEFCDSKKECQMMIICGENYENVCEKIHSIEDNFFFYAQNCHNNISIGEVTQAILGDILYSSYPQKTLQNIIKYNRIEDFSQFSSGKKIIGYNFNENFIKDFEKMLKIIGDLVLLRVDFNFVIFVSEKEKDINIDFISHKLRENFVDNYNICRKEIYKEFCFILFDSNLSYTKIPYRKNNFLEIFDNRIEKIVGLLGDSNNNVFDDEPNEIFESGNGYFDIGSKKYVITKLPTALPYSNVIAGICGGMVTTENGGGYYYFDNSRENKCNRFDNDFCQDIPSELLAVRMGDKCLSVNSTLKNSSFSRCEVKKGLMRYQNYHNGDKYICDIYGILDGKARIIELDMDCVISGYKEILYSFYPCLDWCFQPDMITFSQENDIITITNLRNGIKLYVKFICRDSSKIIYNEMTKYPSFEYIPQAQREKIFVASSKDLVLLLSLNGNNISIEKEKTLNMWDNVTNIELTSNEKAFDLLVYALPYQILSSRIWGKLGFYQVSGATGFRDQLQDSLAFFTRNDIMKNQIIEAIKHQYAQGDVMHWWHYPKLGLRTRISDDKLFLPYAVCEYLDYSKDYAFLEQKYPYLESRPLSANEMSRFENPPYTQYEETVYEHCLRAIKNSLKYGEHNLLAMGSGDWNDGMDYVGSLGRGESVFVSMFAYMVVRKFAFYCPSETKDYLTKTADDLKENINKHAYSKDRYLRLFSDDGRWMGGSGRESFQIDLLVQAFAVISGVADKEIGNTVLNSAKILVDKNLGIVKLLFPPLDKNEYLGYISAYPKGIRENGGQYTHAVMWYLIALSILDRQDEAYELFDMINTVEKCADDFLNSVYKGEPYVFSGDVYSNIDNLGRMGWSWYTGSAGWAYKLVFEYFYGIKKRGEKLVFEPKLPKKLNNSIIKYTYKQSVFIIKYIMSDSFKVVQDEVLCSDNSITLDEKKNSEIIVYVKNSK